MKNPKKNSLKKQWEKYLKNSRMCDWQIKQTVEWNVFHNRKVPKE